MAASHQTLPGRCCFPDQTDKEKGSERSSSTWRRMQSKAGVQGGCFFCRTYPVGSHDHGGHNRPQIPFLMGLGRPWLSQRGKRGCCMFQV